jgi:hypothetical protein
LLLSAWVSVNDAGAQITLSCFDALARLRSIGWNLCERRDDADGLWDESCACPPCGIISIRLP